MARKMQNVENVRNTLQDLEYGEKMKNVKNETQTLFHMECGKKTEKRGR